MTDTIRPPAQEAIDLDAIRERADAATGGPWGVETVGDQYAVMFRGTGAITALCGASDAPGAEEDAEFISAARTDVPTLLAEVERLRADRDRHRTAWTSARRRARIQGARADYINSEADGDRADLVAVVRAMQATEQERRNLAEEVRLLRALLDGASSPDDSRTGTVPGRLQPLMAHLEAHLPDDAAT